MSLFWGAWKLNATAALRIGEGWRREVEEKRRRTEHKVNTNFPQQLSISRVSKAINFFFMLLRAKRNKKNKISYPMEDNRQTRSSDFLLIVWKLLTNRYRSEKKGRKILSEWRKVSFLKLLGKVWESFMTPRGIQVFVVNLTVLWNVLSFVDKTWVE